MTDIERLMSKLETNPSGCWLWRGATNGKYGRVYCGGRQVYAHRASYELHVGPIPAGLHVCHSCDTPLCVNPAHLFVGSGTDNMRDASKKGRVQSGERASQARLNWACVKELRAWNPRAGWEMAAACERYGISRRSIYRVLERQTWIEPHERGGPQEPIAFVAHCRRFQIRKVEPSEVREWLTLGWVSVPPELWNAAARVLFNRNQNRISTRSMGALARWLRGERRSMVNLLSVQARNRKRSANGTFL